MYWTQMDTQFAFLLCLFGYLHSGNAQISMVSNAHLIGGTQQLGISSLGDCILACAADSSCLALDFNSVQSTCWFHFADTVCSAVVLKVGCSNFRFTECPLPVFQQGITSFVGRHVGGGFRRPGVDTIEGCAALCAQIDDCAGFDFDGRDNTCWTHTSQTVCTVFREKPLCTHFRAISCSTSTGAPVTPPSLEYIESFRNLHIFQGTLQLAYTDLDTCYQACYADPLCAGFDWNGPKNQCWFHYSNTVCNTLIAKAGCTHYRLRANCAIGSFATCSDIIFTETQRAHRLEGTLMSGSTTNALCQLLCRARTDCTATDFDLNSNACYLHFSTGIPIPDDCCIHSQKQCNDISTTLVPPTPSPRLPDTTTPTVLEQTTILDNGKCPAEFLKFPSSSHGLGNQVDPAVANTAEECKQYCLNLPGCVAVDFDHTVTSGYNCFYHTNIQPALFSDGTRPCCTHYRRINCEQKQCYVHPEADFQPLVGGGGVFNISAFLDAINIRPGGSFVAPLVDCSGACFTYTTLTIISGAADLTSPYKIQRGCDTSTAVIRKNCEESIVNGETVMRCSCYGDQCNAYGMTLLEECQAYFPFDCSVEDLSFVQRNTETFIYPNLKFDSLDAQKNWSAVFDGTAYLQIPSFSNFQFGNVGQAPEFVHNPAFTITLWVKRTGGTGRQVILSNGGTGSATVEISSFSFGTTHSITASFQIKGIVHRATASGLPLNQWAFIAAMVTPTPLLPFTVLRNPNFYVQLMVDDTSQAAAYTDTGIATNPAVTGSLLIDTSTGDLCIGKQYQASSGERGDFFIGELDEMWFFSLGLSQEQLDSVKGVSLHRERFLP